MRRSQRLVLRSLHRIDQHKTKIPHDESIHTRHDYRDTLRQSIQVPEIGVARQNIEAKVKGLNDALDWIGPEDGALLAPIKTIKLAGTNKGTIGAAAGPDGEVVVYNRIFELKDSHPALTAALLVHEAEHIRLGHPEELLQMIRKHDMPDWRLTEKVLEDEIVAHKTTRDWARERAGRENDPFAIKALDDWIRSSDKVVQRYDDQLAALRAVAPVAAV